MKKSDAELVKDVLQGDQNAFGELVKRYQAAVYGYAYHLLSSFDEAEELCQEAFIQAYTNLSNLKEAERFPSWLRSITRNVCVSFIRQKERLRSFEEAVRKREIPTSAEQYERRVASEAKQSRQLMETVNTLSERNRLLITLFYLDGLSYKKIGDFLEIPINSVKVTLKRARQQLRERLVQMVEESFKEYKLSPEFVKKVSKAIEERKNITLLGVSGSRKAEGERRKAEENNGDDEKVNNLLQEAAQKYGGVLAKRIGEAHLLLFGIPAIHEDDAERAILCAIFLKEKLKEIGLKIKMGINTGLVEIHEQTAKGKIDYIPLGDVLTFTLELMELADGQILTSESIYRLAQGRFVFRQIEREEGEPAVYEALGIPEHPRKLWEGHGFTSPMRHVSENSLHFGG